MLTKDCWGVIASKSKAKEILHLSHVCHAAFTGTKRFIEDIIHLQQQLQRKQICKVYGAHDHLKENFPLISVKKLICQAITPFGIHFTFDSNSIFLVDGGFTEFWIQYPPRVEKVLSCDIALLEKTILRDGGVFPNQFPGF